MSILLAIALNVLPVQSPRNDGQCYNAPRRLGTDNIPLDDTLAHSIVNIWAFIEINHKQPIAFVYRNHSAEYYFEFTQLMSDHMGKSWKIPAKFLDRNHAGINYHPVKVDSDTILRIQQLLLSHNIVLTGCFTHDLKMNR